MNLTLNINERIAGFVIECIRSSEELAGTLVEMRHEKTGAQLIWLDNGESNKLFSIIFKTIPEDDTGVFHILEHSVLCGSEKYPVKEPFVELLKSSMKTYLNASTAPDSTRYPVSSRNDRDFMNLMSVYLDAVFAPRFLTEPNIFYQEGCHIEQEDGELSYKGVVFNEMKGAMSNTGTLIGRKLNAMLFPDNCYGFNSGGAPEAIPDLSYGQFADSYRRFYHPSNARVYLDGAVPLEEALGMLDGYFSRYEKRDDFPIVPMQTPKSCEETIFYEIARGEDMDGKGRLALGKIFGDYTQSWKSAAVYVLKDALAGSNEAPLKKAVLASGLAGNMSIGLSDSYAQHYIRVLFEDVKDGKEDALLCVYRETLRELVSRGVGKDALHASINRLEFMLREPEEPAGLIRMTTAMSAWLYGGDPLEAMCFSNDLAKLRRMADAGEFEALLEDVLLSEKGLAVLHVLPSATVGEEQRAQEKARLQAVKASWTDADQHENALLNESLLRWQQTPDSPEQLAALPKLPLSEVGAEPDFTETIEQEICGVRLLYHPVNVRGIVYFNVYFDLTDCSLDDLTRLSLMTAMLGKLPTQRHDALSLQQMLKRYVGNLEFFLDGFAKKGDRQHCRPVLRVSCSVLEANLGQAIELLAELLTQTRFDCADEIRRFVTQTEINCRQIGAMAGHLLGVISVLSHYSAHDAAVEASSGYSRLKWIQDFSRNFDGQIGDYMRFMQRMAERHFCRSCMTFSLTASRMHAMEALVHALPEGEAVPESTSYKSLLERNLAMRIPARSSYSAQGDHLDRLGFAFDAAYNVGEQIATLDYLWNKVRVQGGAYGTKLSISLSGAIYSYSYRDPTPAASIAANRSAADYLLDFCERGEDVTPYIISTIAKSEPLESPQDKGLSADGDWFMGIGREDYRRMRREMLAADADKLKAFAGILRRFADEGDKCVVGHDEALRACDGMTIVDL